MTSCPRPLRSIESSDSLSVLLCYFWISHMLMPAKIGIDEMVTNCPKYDNWVSICESRFFGLFIGVPLWSFKIAFLTHNLCMPWYTTIEIIRNNPVTAIISWIILQEYDWSNPIFSVSAHAKSFGEMWLARQLNAAYKIFRLYSNLIQFLASLQRSLAEDWIARTTEHIFSNSTLEALIIL